MQKNKLGFAKRGAYLDRYSDPLSAGVLYKFDPPNGSGAPNYLVLRKHPARTESCWHARGIGGVIQVTPEDARYLEPVGNPAEVSGQLVRSAELIKACKGKAISTGKGQLPKHVETMVREMVTHNLGVLEQFVGARFFAGIGDSDLSRHVHYANYVLSRAPELVRFILREALASQERPKGRWD